MKQTMEIGQEESLSMMRIKDSYPVELRITTYKIINQMLTKMKQKYLSKCINKH